MKVINLILRRLLPYLCILALTVPFSCQKPAVSTQPGFSFQDRLAIEAISELEKIDLQAALTIRFNDSTNIYWEPQWQQTAIKKVSDTVDFIFIPVIGYATINDKPTDRPVKPGYNRRFIIGTRKKGDFITYSLGTYVYDSISYYATKQNVNQLSQPDYEEFTGVLVQAPLSTGQFRRIVYKQGKALPIKQPQEKARTGEMSPMSWVCSYYKVCQWGGMCEMGYTVTVTTSPASSQPDGYPCTYPMLPPDCSGSSSLVVIDQKTEMYCSETSGSETPIPPAPPPTPPSGSGPSESVGNGYPPVDASLIHNIPCPSSFVFNKNENYQTAVVTDYKFSLSCKGQIWTVDIGQMEVQMPAVTFEGSLIQSSIATSITTQAAGDAEHAVMAVLNAYLLANPGITHPSQLNLSVYKSMFKAELQRQIDYFLKHDYYDGQDIHVARVIFDNTFFIQQDPTKYRTMKFFGRDC